MEECIFCKIVRGEIPSKKIYEDESVYAFLDINPKSKGHTLVIPKKHSADIFEIEENDLEDVIKVVQQLAVHIKEKLNPEGMQLRQNNGEIAGQSVNHLHFHIIPKYTNEDEYDIDEVHQLLKKD